MKDIKYFHSIFFVKSPRIFRNRALHGSKFENNNCCKICYGVL